MCIQGLQAIAANRHLPIFGQNEPAASRDHGDARQAVALLAKSAYLAGKVETRVSLEIVDHACSEIEQDKYVTMISTAPRQLQAAMAAVIQ